MSTDTHIQLTELCTRYAEHANLSHWRVSFLARGDGQFFKRLSGGGSCTLRTAAQVFLWFSDHWPSDLEWPADIPRPDPKKEVA